MTRRRRWLARLTVPFGGRRRREPAANATMADGVPAVSVYPVGLDHGYELARMRQAYRASLVMNFLLIGVALLSAATVFALLPLQQVVPLLLTVHPASEQVVEVQPLVDTRTDAAELMTQGLVRQWVEHRLAVTPDEALLRARLTWMMARSEPGVLEAMADEMRPLMADARQRDLVRSVEVRAIAPQGSVEGGSLYLVDFTLHHRERGTATTSVEGRASIRVTYVAQRLDRRQQIYDQDPNPFGFRVTAFSREK